MSRTRSRTPDIEWAPLPIDPRDVADEQDPDTIIGTKGPVVVSCLTIHIPGHTLRADLYRSLHDQIHGKSQRSPDPGGRPPCGVEHVEDIGIWQAPHSGRDELRRAVQAVERHYRRPVVILHAWQHYGPCPHFHHRGRPNGRDRSLTMAIGTVPTDSPVESSGEVYIKFRGMKAGTDDIAVPELGDIMEFAVTAECVSVGTEKRADGERRPVIGMRVMEVEPGEISKAPVDDQLPFNENADDEL